MKNIFLITAVIFLGGCTMILNPKFQKTDFEIEDSLAKLYINNKLPDTIEGKVLLKRDNKMKQITLKKDGYKDFDTVVAQYRLSPIFYANFPFIYTFVFDIAYSKKLSNYEKQININNEFIKLHRYNSISKKIQINNVRCIETKYETPIYSYRKFVKGKGPIKKDYKLLLNTRVSNIAYIKNQDSYKLAINKLIKEKGLMETTKTTFNKSFVNNLMVDATISNVNYTEIINNRGARMYLVEIEVIWQALDYYKTPIYTMKVQSRSGLFSNRNLQYTIKDALDNSLTEFLIDDSVQIILHDRSVVEIEKSFSEIIIPKSDKYVSSVSESIAASITVKSKRSFGSGFIISENGYIITNHHVVSDTNNLTVILEDGKEYPAKVIRSSKMHDIALLKIDAKGLLPFIISNSKEIEVSSIIYAIGTPTSEDLSQTISRGIISAVRDKNGAKLIQTDASINSGNSGGPIINKQGVVIGIVSSKLIGYTVEGVAFGIPAYEIFDRLNLKIE